MGRAASDRSAGRDLRRRQHRDGCRPGRPQAGGHRALIIYRRTRAQMPAHAFEADEAEREGIKIHWLRTIKTIDGPDLTVEVMQLDAERFPEANRRSRDARSGFLDPRPRAGHRHRVLEQVPGVAFGPDGTVEVGAAMMTGCPGVFAGGDMVPAERSVTVGVATARRRRAHRRVAALTHRQKPRARLRWSRSISCTSGTSRDVARREQAKR